MKTFKDLKFKKTFGGVNAFEELGNGIGISVAAGKINYSTPREELDDPSLFSSFEVAIFGETGEFTREFFPDNYHDNVMGWQDRDEISALMLSIQSKNI